MAFNERYINPNTDGQAEIAKFSPEDQRQYEDSIKADRDINNAINTAKADVKTELACKMKAKGYAIEDIAEITGLTPEQIEAL